MPDRAPTSEGRAAGRDGAGRGLTVGDVAALLRVGQDKVRFWISKGELQAINTASSVLARPRWVILPAALLEFARKRAGGPPLKAPRARKRQPAGFRDYYPDAEKEAK